MPGLHNSIRGAVVVQQHAWDSSMYDLTRLSPQGSNPGNTKGSVH
jgi:hypothetical protein